MSTQDTMGKYPIRQMNQLLAVLVLAFLAIRFTPPLKAFQGIHVMHLWVHSFVEMFSTTIALLLFGVVWNAYSKERAGNMIFLGCAFLAVGLLDFAHLLSYKGMPDFVTPASPQKAIVFWLSARMVAALALLTVAIRHWRPLPDIRMRHIPLTASLMVTAIVYWLCLYRPEAWPQFFIEGTGLTDIKVLIEYAIVVILGAAAVLFYRDAKRPHTVYDAGSLFSVSVISILSELCFTSYAQVNDLFNLLGHLFKIAAYLFLYRAAFVACVREPFRKMHIEIGERRGAEVALQELSAFLQQVREEERTRIARELHDELGQALTALKIDLSWLGEKLPAQEQRISDKLASMMGLLNRTVDAIRRISEDLRPGMLDDLGLAAAIEHHAAKFAEQTGIACDLSMDRDHFELDDRMATALFRLLQESLTNVARHANATEVTVRLQQLDSEMLLIVKDNGCGLPAPNASKKKTYGLLGMHERVRLLGGTLDVSGSPGNGTRIEASIPLPRTNKESQP